jgi:hypothetical protein
LRDPHQGRTQSGAIAEGNENHWTTQSRSSAHKKASRDARLSPTLGEMGITFDQSSQWQQLADVPEEQFEAEMRKPVGKPSTEALLPKRKISPLPQMDPDALKVWDVIREFEADGLLDRDPRDLWAVTNQPTRDTITRIIPVLCDSSA